MMSAAFVLFMATCILLDKPCSNLSLVNLVIHVVQTCCRLDSMKQGEGHCVRKQLFRWSRRTGALPTVDGCSEVTVSERSVLHLVSCCLANNMYSMCTALCACNKNSGTGKNHWLAQWQLAVLTKSNLTLHVQSVSPIALMFDFEHLII